MAPHEKDNETSDGNLLDDFVVWVSFDKQVAAIKPSSTGKSRGIVELNGI
jgi:hypothetical protein